MLGHVTGLLGACNASERERLVVSKLDVLLGKLLPNWNVRRHRELFLVAFCRLSVSVICCCSSFRRIMEHSFGGMLF